MSDKRVKLQYEDDGDGCFTCTDVKISYFICCLGKGRSPCKYPTSLHFRHFV